MLRFGAMPLDHLFIQEYLPGAKGDYVKVYIYGLYLSQHSQPDMGLEEMARELGIETAEAEAALRYWERRRLVSRVSDNPPEYLFRGAAQLAQSGETAMEADAGYVAFSEDVYALFGSDRKVRPADIALCWEWVQDMNLPQETVLMLLSHMKATRGVQFSFRSAQAEAVRMSEEHVQTAEDAESYFSHSRALQDGARAVLRQLGRRRTPSQNELDLYRKWTEDWGYTQEAVIAACAETTKGEPTFAYLDGILKGMRERSGGQSSRSGGDVARQLQTEKAENQAVQKFAHSLGFRTATDMVRKAYARLCGQFDPQIVQLAADETYRAGGDLEKTEIILERLRGQGITTLEAARSYFEEAHRLNAALAPIFEKSGHRGTPTVGDRTLYRKWKEWGFSDEMLLLAASQARGAARKMPYMDKILESWRQNGVTTPAQAAAHAAPAKDKKVSAQQYEQRRYTEEELENRTDDL
ncbi:MAG: DnaD domain protein [Clostridia bacterium]|nr:DnaD domain protein [Clostridia bacterium]